MAKYSFEFKKRVVTAYLDGKGGCKALAKEYGVGNECIVRRWVHNYEVFGDDGLLRSRKNAIYSFEKKLHIENTQIRAILCSLSADFATLPVSVSDKLL